MTNAEDARRAALAAEIQERLGHVPTFFRLGASAEIAEDLWRQAQAAYLDSPIPSSFQEPLFTYLSRFCEIPYCMAHHAALLQGRGGLLPGAGTATRYRPEEVLQLLRRPVARAGELESCWKTLADYDDPIDAWPEDLESHLGEALFACAVHVFLKGGAHTRCLAELRRVLGPEKLERLIAFLSFVRSAHAWTEAHEGPEFERDIEEMLDEQPKLRDWIERYRSVVESELGAEELHHLTTERRELRESAEQLGVILEDSLNEIYVFDAETLRFTQANRGARENLGYSMVELRELTPVDLKPEFTEASFRELVAPLRSRRIPRLEFTTSHRRKDGSVYPIETHLQLTSAGGAFVAFILDLTESEKNEAEIARLGAQARAILDTAVDAIVTIDESAIIVGVNAATQKLFGYPESELVGQNVRILMPPPHGTRHHDYVERYLRTGEARVIGASGEYEARHKDGSVFPIRLAVGEADFDHQRLFTGIIHDLSKTRNLQGQLLHSQKMEAVGTLAGGIAHDFNNLLTSIRGSSEILVDQLEPGGRLARSARRIQRAADRAAALTARLLGFSRKQVTRRRALDLNAAIEEARELVAHMLSEDMEQKTDLCLEAPYVYADENQISQVLMNLVVNAADAMRPGGCLCLATDREAIDDERAEALGVPAGDYVVLRVRDSGAGMSPETLVKIFDPFFTTKEVGKGTGLGLSTVFAIVHECGGAITADSEVGVGTTFTILLPEVDAPKAGSTAAADDTARTRRSGETVLLVEDDEILRELVVEVLEYDGFVVVSAAEPEEALRRAHEHAGGIDLVITDVVMPSMSGFLLAKELRSHQPQARVLYMSGYTDQVLAERGELKDDDPFIRKPFGNDALLEKVREVLAAPAPSA